MTPVISADDPRTPSVTGYFHCRRLFHPTSGILRALTHFLSIFQGKITPGEPSSIHSSSTRMVHMLGYLVSKKLHAEKCPALGCTIGSIPATSFRSAARRPEDWMPPKHSEELPLPQHAPRVARIQPVGHEHTCPLLIFCSFQCTPTSHNTFPSSC